MPEMTPEQEAHHFIDTAIGHAVRTLSHSITPAERRATLGLIVDQESHLATLIRKARWADEHGVKVMEAAGLAIGPCDRCGLVNVADKLRSTLSAARAAKEQA